MILYQDLMSGTVFSTMVSSLVMSVNNGCIVCLAQSTDSNNVQIIRAQRHVVRTNIEKLTDGIEDVVSIEDDNGNIDENKIVSVIPKDEIQKGSALDFDYRNCTMQKQSVNILKKGRDQVKKNISMWQIASQAKNIKSSGYGKEAPRGKMFEPVINKPKLKKNSLPLPGEDRRDGCLSRRSTQSTPDLSSDRARWRLDQSDASSKLLNRSVTQYSPHSPPPTQIKSRIRIWDTSGTKSHITFSKTGKCLAVSGANNSAQVLHSYLLDNYVDSSNQLLKSGHQLVGHTASVNSLDFSQGGDWLVSAGEDNVVKLWDWKSRRVMMDVNSKRAVYGDEAYGVTRKLSKDPPLFTEPGLKSRFFYMDSLLLSSCGNKLFLHRVHLPNQAGDSPSYKLTKATTLGDFKHIAALSCVNQFYSFLALASCSDKTLRVVDFNQGAVVRTFPRCHPRTPHKVVQNEGTIGISHPEQGYDLFVTTAVTDGAKLWDLRSVLPVQKFDTFVNHRYQCGVALSPCLRYLASGGEDGCVYLYDTRKVTTCLSRLATGCDVITEVAFSPRTPQLVAISSSGLLLTYMTQ